MKFSRTIKIHFNDADPAGICFFANIFTKVHQVYEDYLSELSTEPVQWFLSKDWAFPIRQTEAEFYKPLLAMESYPVEIQPMSLSETTFSLQYTIGDRDTPHAVLETVHTCIDPKKMKKKALPEDFRKTLASLMNEAEPA